MIPTRPPQVPINTPGLSEALDGEMSGSMVIKLFSRKFCRKEFFAKQKLSGAPVAWLVTCFW